MFDFYERRKLRHFLYSKVFLLVLFLLIILLAKGVWGVYSSERDTSRKRVEKAAELQDLLDRQMALTAELQRLSTKRGIESELRQKYEVVKEGEEMIVLVQPPKENIPGASENRNIWEWFKGLF
ncbi:hypothetical protein A3D66_01900 [Candidatus Kaiserbacteria bacterium RIFCSPHIGHO2_02_FULL_50_9]|uniref:Cell division protein FtsL n=1 Tax=Candidatus Kaiserbacteria bacterium RIFCSPLOWO2_01_FULL_51_21 TaxID=1798508 RepID=A0A1F6ED97_9BACT|nr:MAG: hypothetical protein A2761_02165 [Candidatus Kaiserbacteria bacterium RIFCSPHIGHO2_01_FULL_51_33]OGG63800.1 MAG: hypothetical protein A3D66_01900 [Candidatus Kaiserbacteria bacterium RIFCSPHIGHO2_02_FULL_50_9]OGG71580.1 MAG: hypothetical protein A3A35_01790 [Candidatus Kaiserbacteria bacterium RIFCSPLOWO2_01_FULL_51_21]